MTHWNDPEDLALLEIYSAASLVLLFTRTQLNANCNIYGGEKTQSITTRPYPCIPLQGLWAEGNSPKLHAVLETTSRQLEAATQSLHADHIVTKELEQLHALLKKYMEIAKPVVDNLLPRRGRLSVATSVKVREASPAPADLVLEKAASLLTTMNTEADSKWPLVNGILKTALHSEEAGKP